MADLQRSLAALVVATTLAGCAGSIGGQSDPIPEPASDTPSTADPRWPPAAPTTPTATMAPPTSASSDDGPVLRRLTDAQYRNSVSALLGPSLRLPELPDDERVDLFRARAAVTAGIPALDVEQYTRAAYEVAAQVFRDPRRRMAVAGCAPASVEDRTCATAFLGGFMRRAWRRPVEDGELARYVAGATSSARAAGDPWRGLEEAVAAVLLSPSFLMRVETVETDPETPGRKRFDGYAMATRLSFLFLDAPPADALLDQAAKGALATTAGLRAAATALAADPRAKAALPGFFADLLGTAELAGVSKDRKAHPLAVDSFPASLRTSAAMFLTSLLEDPGGYAALLTSRDVFADATLARIYDLTPPSSGFARVKLPADGPRAGYLGQAPFLALHAGQTDTSPTHRGLAVRRALLCQEVPDPPPGVQQQLPVPPPGVVWTSRERSEALLGTQACAACHGLMDTVGFPLEAFDAIGKARSTDGGRPVRTSSALDGRAVADLPALNDAVAAHPAFASCVGRQLFRHATGLRDGAAEAGALAAFGRTVVERRSSIAGALVELVASDVFRFPAGVR